MDISFFFYPAILPAGKLVGRGIFYHNALSLCWEGEPLVHFSEGFGSLKPMLIKSSLGLSIHSKMAPGVVIFMAIFVVFPYNEGNSTLLCAFLEPVLKLPLPFPGSQVRSIYFTVHTTVKTLGNRNKRNHRYIFRSLVCDTGYLNGNSNTLFSQFLTGRLKGAR